MWDGLLLFFLSVLNMVKGTTIFLTFFLISLCMQVLCCNVPGHLYNLLKRICRIQLKNDSLQDQRKIFMYLKLQSRQAALSPVSCKQVSSCFCWTSACVALQWQVIKGNVGLNLHRCANTVFAYSVCCNLNPSLLKVFVFPGKLHCSVTCITPY